MQWEGSQTDYDPCRGDAQGQMGGLVTWLDVFLVCPVETEGGITTLPWDPTHEALCVASPEDAPYLREERAGILSCSGLPTEEAEHLAGLR